MVMITKVTKKLKQKKMISLRVTFKKALKPSTRLKITHYPNVTRPTWEPVARSMRANL